MFERFSRLAHTSAELVKKILAPVAPARIVSAYALLSKQDRIRLWSTGAIALAGVLLGSVQFYFSHTIEVPARGGVFVQGAVGQPDHINPALPDQNETDQVLQRLVFSGLTKPDGQGGLIFDLAQNIEAQPDHVTYLVTLKPNLVWQDGEPLTSQDILFTIGLLKNPVLENPQASFWNTVQVRAVSNTILTFTLSNPNAYFPSYLDFGILPFHLWKSIPISQMTISELNLKPIGSGPYEFKKITLAKDHSIAEYTLARFSNYASDGPYFDTVAVKFYPSVDEALTALKKKDIDSLAHIPPDTFKKQVTQHDFTSLSPLTNVMTLLAFNTTIDPFKDHVMRQAVQASIDTNVIAHNVLGGYALTEFNQFQASSSSLFNPDAARSLLASLGWRDTDNDGIVDRTGLHQKTPTNLTVTLLILDTPDMQRIASLIQSQLKQTGTGVTIQALDVNDYTSKLQNRSFQLALISYVPMSATVPDLYPLLHSSQIQSPGLNMSGYMNSAADGLLEQIRTSSDSTTKQALWDQLITRVTDDAPMIFIGQPRLLWLMAPAIHRPDINAVSSVETMLATINQWYWYTKRIWIR